MSKVKKGNKGSKNVKNNVIPFKTNKLEKIKNVTPMSKEEVETARVNDYAKEVCKNLDDFASNAGIDVERFYYNFLFYIKQAVIMKLSYPAFKYLDKGKDEARIPHKYSLEDYGLSRGEVHNKLNFS